MGFFKTTAELGLILQSTRNLGISVNKFNLTNKARNERDHLLKSANKIFEWGVSENLDLDVCIHYSMKNNKGKTVEESLAILGKFLQQASSLSSSSSRESTCELLLCSGGGKKKTKPDTIQVLAMLPPASIPPNISLAVAYNPYEEDIQGENLRLKEKLLYNVEKIYLQFGSDLNKLREGMEFINGLNKERLQQGKIPLKIIGSVMIPSKQLL